MRAIVPSNIGMLVETKGEGEQEKKGEKYVHIVSMGLEAKMPTEECTMDGWASEKAHLGWIQAHTCSPCALSPTYVMSPCKAISPKFTHSL